MNMAEVYNAIRQVQKEPEIIRYICMICKGYISNWDSKKGYAICWRCRRALSPARKVAADRRPQKAIVVYRIVDRPSYYPREDWGGRGYNQLNVRYVRHEYFPKPFAKEKLVP